MGGWGVGGHSLHERARLDAWPLSRHAYVYVCGAWVSQVQEICDRVGILARGSLVREGRVEDLLSIRDRTEMVLENISPEKVEALTKAAQNLGVKVVSSGQLQTTLEQLFLEAIEPSQSADAGSGGK